MLKVSDYPARRFNLKEGLSSTDAVNDSISRYISGVNLTHFPGIFRRNQDLLESLLKSQICRKVKVHGHAV